jgi:hypothetical protein
MKEIEIRLNTKEFKDKLNIKDGVDGKTPTKKELISIIKPLIPEPKKEIIIEKTEVIKEVANSDTGEEIVNKINKLPIKKDKQIGLKHISGLDEFLEKNYPKIIPGSNSGGGGHTIQDEGTSLPQRTNLNFIGEGVTATDNDVTDSTDVTIPISATGGMKSWFFTKEDSDISGLYKATTTLPTRAIQEITVSAIKETETVIAEFLTELQTADYRVIDGSRFFYVTARTDNTHQDIKLKGYIYTTDIDGTNPVLLRTSSFSIPILDTDAMYDMNTWGGALLIPTTTRVKFVITATNTHNADHDVTISVEDDTFSRLDVPSPVGVTKPGDPDKSVQFNDGGTFGGDAGFTYDKITKKLYVNFKEIGSGGGSSGIFNCGYRLTGDELLDLGLRV